MSFFTSFNGNIFYFSHDLDNVKKSMSKVDTSILHSVTSGMPKYYGYVTNLAFYNKDGSEAELCCNAIFALISNIIHRTRHLSFNAPLDATFLTKAGMIIKSTVRYDPSIYIQLEMPKVQNMNLFYKYHIDLIGTVFEPEFVKKIKPFIIERIFYKKIGNPHCILLIENFAQEQFFNDISVKISDYYNGINVHFTTHINDNIFEVQCFERGVGQTEACGSGAYAIAIAMREHFKISESDPIIIKMKGGEYRIENNFLISNF